MKKIFCICAIITTLFATEIFSQTLNINYIIENKEDAQNAYSEALYYKERALATGSLNETSKTDLENARDILIEVLKYIPNKEIYITLADTYDALGDFKSSSDIYEQLVDLNSDEISVKAGERQLFLIKNLEKAIYYLNNAYEINMKNNDALILLGYIYYELGERKKALSYLSKVDETRESYYIDYYNYYYAMCEFYESMFQNSLTRLKKININTLLGADRYEALYATIKNYQALEDYTNAYSNSMAARNIIDNLYLSAFLSFMANDYNEELFNEVDAVNINIPKVLSIAMTAQNEGITNALNMIEIEIDRGNIDLDVAQMYYMFIQKIGGEKEKKQSEIDLISFYMQLGNADSIPKHLERLIGYEKSYVELYLPLASLFIEHYDFKNAKMCLEKYLSLSGKNDINENNIMWFAVMACNIEEYDLGLKAIEKFESKDNNYAYLKAHIYSKKQDYKNADKYLNEDYIYIENNPQEITTHRLDISYSVSLNTKNRELAQKYAEIFFNMEEMKELESIYLNNKAWALIYLDIDLDKGIELALKSTEYSPNDVHSLDTLGLGYYKKGDYKKALKTFLNAAFYVDDYTKAELYSHIADTYYKLKDYENALRYYRKSLTSNYKNSDFDIERIETIIRDLTK